MDGIANLLTCPIIAHPVARNVPNFLKFIKKSLNKWIYLSDPAVIWFLVGLGLLLLELVLPGLVILFFGVGAWVTALVCAFTDISLNWQILIFLVASLAGSGFASEIPEKTFLQQNRQRNPGPAGRIYRPESQGC